MSEDSIQRPQRRRGPIDMDEPSGHTEQKEKKSLFSKKDTSKVEPEPRSNDPFTAEENKPKKSLFGKKEDTVTDTGRQTSDDLFTPSTRTTARETGTVTPQRTVEMPPRKQTVEDQTPKKTETKASIDLGGGSPAPKVSVGQTTETSKPRYNSFDVGGTPSSKPAQNSFDVGGTSMTETPSKPQKKSFAAILPFGNQEEEDRKGTWGDRDYSANDEQAHRDRKYHIPPMMKQTLIVFMVQMKLFAKQKWTYFMLFAAMLIPIVYFVGGDVIKSFMWMFGFSSDYSNTFIAGLLAFMPLMLGLFTSVLCGSQLPNEFKERTAYMNISLPLDRVSFYLGKYLAGFLMSLGVFMFAYGMAIATAMTEYDSIFADLLSESLMLTIVGVFAYSATAFCIGSFMKRGSSMVPFILMTIVLPLVLALLYAYFELDGPDLSGLFYLPCFLGEAALGLLGAPMTGSVGMIVLQYMDLSSVGINAAVGIIWGILFLILGMVKTKRREM